MKRKIKLKKGHYLLGSCLLLLLAILLYLPHHYELYKQTIGQVTEIHELAGTKTVDWHGNRDEKRTQTLTVQVLNGVAKGEVLQLRNEYNLTQINNQRYRVGDNVFIHLTDSTQAEERGQLDGKKRDETLVYFVALFLLLLFFVGGRSGLFAIASLVLNSALLLLLLDYFMRGKTQHLTWTMLIALPFLIGGSLFLVSGWSLKTAAAIMATLAGTLTSFVIGWLVITLLNHKGLRYEEMDFLTRSPHTLFITSLLLGCLGAVMDVAMTIVSAMLEAASQNTTATLADVKAVGRQVGRDIVGPMSNVLLFSYLSGSLPLILIYLRNQIDLSYTFATVLSLEIARALVGSLGIVLTVPLTILSVSLLLQKRGVLQ